MYKEKLLYCKLKAAKTSVSIVVLWEITCWVSVHGAHPGVFIQLISVLFLAALCSVISFVLMTALLKWGGHCFQEHGTSIWEVINATSWHLKRFFNRQKAAQVVAAVTVLFAEFKLKGFNIYIFICLLWSNYNHDQKLRA